MFLKVHDEYARLVSNPFYPVDSPITGELSFVETVTELSTSYLKE